MLIWNEKKKKKKHTCTHPSANRLNLLSINTPKQFGLPGLLSVIRPYTGFVRVCWLRCHKDLQVTLAALKWSCLQSWYAWEICQESCLATTVERTVLKRKTFYNMWIWVVMLRGHFARWDWAACIHFLKCELFIISKNFKGLFEDTWMKVEAELEVDLKKYT